VLFVLPQPNITSS